MNERTNFSSPSRDVVSHLVSNFIFLFLFFFTRGGLLCSFINFVISLPSGWGEITTIDAAAKKKKKKKKKLFKKSRVTQTPILSFPRAQRSVKGKEKRSGG